MDSEHTFTVKSLVDRLTTCVASGKHTTLKLGTKRSSLFAYRVTLILNDRVIIKGVQDIMKKKIPDGPTERERHV